MVAAPSIAMIFLLAALSFFGATILRRPWQKWMAFGLGVAEVIMLAMLIYEVRI